MRRDERDDEAAPAMAAEPSDTTATAADLEDAEPSGGSVLDGLGGQLTAIIAPVSLCMVLVVALVCVLLPGGAPEAGPAIATLVYQERASDPPGAKLVGALLNALVFVGAIAVVTFALVGLFYLRCTRLIWAYMTFSGFTILAWMGGSVAVQLVQALSLPVDAVTFAILLYNFAVVGVLAVFSPVLPLLLTQSYLVAIGAVVAFWFTQLPEWTTWLLLAAMAVYDLVAVLVPGGPLKMLVEMAMERNEDIPALVYEARSSVVRRVPPASEPRDPERSESSPSLHTGRRERLQAARVNLRPTREGGEFILRSNGDVQHEGEPLALEGLQGKPEVQVPTDASSSTPNYEGRGSGTRTVPLSSSVPLSDPKSTPAEEELRPLILEQLPPVASTTESTMGPGRVHPMALPVASGADLVQRRIPVLEADQSDDDGVGEFELRDAIKLGLGDFIFYSVLVGRAAMYDLMTVYACYLAVIAGLGLTLILLALHKKALPALPISIALGITFYLLTRLLVEPFAVSLSSNLLFL